MTTMALSPLRENLVRASSTAQDDVRLASKAVWFAKTWFGHTVDSCGSYVVARMYLSLERDVIFFRGASTQVTELDPDYVIDSAGNVSPILEKLVIQARQLHEAAEKCKGDRRLPKTHKAFEKLTDITGLLKDAVVDLQNAVAEHDAEARLGGGELKAVNDSFNNLFESIKQGTLVPSSDEARELAKSAAERRHQVPDADWPRRLASNIKDAHD